jgi:hypothetical protein
MTVQRAKPIPKPDEGKREEESRRAEVQKNFYGGML